jgi:hypothetical protein
MTDETTNPNRWTAEVHMQAGTNGTGYAVWLYERGQYHGNIYLGLQADCDKLAEQINRPAPTAPADDLPPGYIGWNGETWAMPGAPGIVGWEWTDPSFGSGWHACEGGCAIDSMNPTKVRPITPAEPVTEWVPVLDAIKNGRVLIAPDGSLMETKGHEVLVYLGRSGRWRCMYDDAGHAEAKRPHADADGKVEVQR